MDEIKVKADGDHKRLRVWELIVFLILVLFFIIAGILFLT